MGRSWIPRTLKRLWHRHHWSLPLSIASAVCFGRLASEMKEGDVDALDRAVQRAVDTWRGSADRLMLGFTEAGDLTSMSLVTAVGLAVLAASKRAREVRYLFVGACGSLVLNCVLKVAFQRARPDASLVYLTQLPTSLSFPSGHTMGTTGVIGCLVVLVHVVRARRPLRWIATACGAAVIAGVGLSRIYLGAHYPSDVFGGFLAAASWVSALTGWMYPRLLPGEAAVRG
jgi:undecaprenyl-diphosphatase